MVVDILMATYNGEKYIKKQLDSILSQSYGDFKLYISDDNSKDKTVSIIKEYQKKYPEKIYLSINYENSGSPMKNFLNLIKSSKADIIFTCDQDDIWDKDKVEITIKQFKDNEPTLVHTDLRVIDENDRLLFKSMIKQQKIDVKRDKLNNLIVQNIVTGCTMAINRALAEILKDIEDINVHDWYIANVASIYGKIIFIDRATISYRKHSLNECGAQNMYSFKYLFKRFKNKEKARNMLDLSYKLASEIYEKHKDISDDYKKLLYSYSRIKRYNKIRRIYIIFKYKIFKSGFIRKIGQIVFL